MITALAICIGLAVLIGLHEAAHMTVAKLFGVKVIKFAVGFGPILFKKQIGETSYELRILPLGGFVQFHGECPSKRIERGFFSISWWKRSLVALAGPLMNLLISYVLLVGLLIVVREMSLVDSLVKAYKFLYMATTMTLEWIGKAVAAKANSGDVGGPIAITNLMVSAFKAGFADFTYVLAIISLSLGIFNLLPIPGLDGGHIVLYSVEGLLRKPLSAKVYAIWSALGFMLLIGLMVAVTFMDLLRILFK